MRCSSVMIADRCPVVLQGLKNVLGAKSGFKVVACCSDGATCMEAIRSLVPDIAILDISMPGLTGLEILAIANTENLRTRLVFFTESVEDRELVMAAAAGAYGVILKDAAPEILVQSLRQVADGQKLPCWDQAVSRDQRNIAIVANVLTVLTDRERQIMALVCEGLSNKEIGRRLNVAGGTIKVHLHHVYQKLEISNRTVLAALAISQNEISGPDRHANHRREPCGTDSADPMVRTGVDAGMASPRQASFSVRASGPLPQRAECHARDNARRGWPRRP
jgi:two-component system, NarL family, nitrate/nitrite response regulator NarL